jgi:murein DD-endopeptidase MepM/ murein hydrolase activator NlpD
MRRNPFNRQVHRSQFVLMVAIVITLPACGVGPPKELESRATDIQLGTPVTAPATGVVTAAESLYFTGNTLGIDHGLGLYSVLAHLSKFAVTAGDSVRRGQVVGFVGATGRVTGAHLHWSVRLNGARVDPLSLIAATKESKETSE